MLLFFCALGGTLAFYLFKCKLFRAGCIPSDKFPVNQDCLPFHLLPHTPHPPSPLRKLMRKCFIVKQEKETFSDSKEMFSYVQENWLFMWCYLYNEIAHTCWTETLKKTFTYFCLTPLKCIKSSFTVLNVMFLSILPF